MKKPSNRQLQKRISRYPSKVQICGYDFSLEYLKSITDKDGTVLSGETLADHRLIRISMDENRTDDEVERTLLHEVLHAILDLSGQTEGLTEEKEEGIVKALENALFLMYERRNIQGESA